MLPLVGERSTVRFYVPEWEDHVDAEYDFANDEHSTIVRSDRNLAYIWDIFDRDPARTPIDGVLISREQIEDSPKRARRLKEYGVYNAPNDGTTLSIPEWLPTISDCGAWGYKELPFPPYGNEEMLEFYEKLDVDVGVTIDHLVLGSGHASRLYVDEKAFSDSFDEDDIPDAITDTIDLMIDEWPEWPDYVEDYEPSITGLKPPETPIEEVFDINIEGLDPEEDSEEIEKRVKDHFRSISDDPRIVYRDDDMEFRFKLTLDNLREMRKYYEKENYSFRLMSAIQGWDTSSYSKATRAALSEGYQYLGIGGVAGSNESDVKRYVSAVGNVVKDYERAHTTRVDTHVFGFAKTGAFETIGQSGMTSFDSASMLRAAWTGGQNYHLENGDSDRRFDALRVRYPGHRGDLSDAIETALWSQEVLTALHAYDEGDSIPSAIRRWHDSAYKPLAHLEEYLREHRLDDRYNQRRLKDLTETFRSHYECGRELKANFSDRFRKRIIKLLREEDPEDPVPFEKYTELVNQAQDCLRSFPRTAEAVEEVSQTGLDNSFEAVWTVVDAYTASNGDEDHREGYRELLRNRPWEECDCPVCTDLGIDVAIFRGNNRNRRRGFHNTRRFYDQMEKELPKTLVVTKGDTSLTGVETVETFLKKDRTQFWERVHDLPVAEVGVVTASGFHEWWEAPPTTLSFDPDRLLDNLTDMCGQYQDIYIDGTNWEVTDEIKTALRDVECTPHVIKQPKDLRRAVLDRLEYDERTIPPHPERDLDQIGISNF